MYAIDCNIDDFQLFMPDYCFDNSTDAIISDFVQKCKHLSIFTGLSEVGNPNLEAEPFQIEKWLNLPQCPYTKRLKNLISFLSHQ